MRRISHRLAVACVLLLVAAPLFAHDMFLRLSDYFVAPNSSVSAFGLSPLFNSMVSLWPFSVKP